MTRGRVFPCWYTPEQLPRWRVPARLRGWLLDAASLTARLRAACGEFRVELLQQGGSAVLHDEMSLLDLQKACSQHVRQVRLYCDDQPCVFARTVIPSHSLVGRYRRLLVLGERPLGEVLFSDRSIVRGPMQVARLLPHHRLFQMAALDQSCYPEILWARRSLFYLAGRPLLVNEVFLPSVLFGGVSGAR